MTETQRAEAKEVYRAYMKALDAHLHHMDDNTVSREWSAAYAKWVRTMRDQNLGRFDRESIHEEVVAELTMV